MTSSLSADAQAIADLLLRVYEIHERIITKTGGLEGLRDGTMLHTAVARPFTTRIHTVKIIFIRQK